MKIITSILVMLTVAMASVYAGEGSAGKRYVATVGEDGYPHVEMTAGSYYFDPSIVVVQVNVPVELTIRKEPGITPHNLVMHSPEADLDFEFDLSSDPKKVAFLASRTGIYSFECTNRFLFFKSNKDRGMHGVLEMVE